MKFPKEQLKADAILSVNITMDTKEMKGGIDKIVLRPPGNALIEKFEHTGLLTIKRSYKLRGEEKQPGRRKRGFLDKFLTKDNHNESTSENNEPINEPVSGNFLGGIGGPLNNKVPDTGSNLMEGLGGL